MRGGWERKGRQTEGKTERENNNGGLRKHWVRVCVHVCACD